MAGKFIPDHPESPADVADNVLPATYVRGGCWACGSPSGEPCPKADRNGICPEVGARRGESADYGSVMGYSSIDVAFDPAMFEGNVIATGVYRIGGLTIVDRDAIRAGSSGLKFNLSDERLAEIAAIPDDAIDTSDIREAGPEFFERARGAVHLARLNTPACVMAGVTKEGAPDRNHLTTDPKWVTCPFCQQIAVKDALRRALGALKGGGDADE